MVAMNSRIEERGRRDREQGKGRGGKKGEENEDEESCRTRSRKGGCGWHHWELFIPLYYTSASSSTSLLRALLATSSSRETDTELRIPSFARTENLRPVDRYLETRWRASRQLSHRLIATSSANHLLLLLLFSIGQNLFFHRLVYI